MKYVQINAYSISWAESIVFRKHYELLSQGIDSYVFWGRGDHEQDEHMKRFATSPSVYADAFLTRIDGRAGFHSRWATRRLIRWLDEVDPDVVHLHVLCGYYVNVEMLFDWLMNHRCQVKWTLHDCWAFTGHCIHFTYVQCTQWKTRCGAHGACPQTNAYPESLFGGNVEWNFENKKRLFTMLPAERMSLIAPSRWLAGLVKQSFLSKYDVEVVHNTINKNVFKPVPNDFRERYGIEGKFIVLGVASKWSERKGLDDFVRLAKELDERFAIVLIGLSTNQLKELPEGIIGLPRVNDAIGLASAYSASDVFFNPTQEDNYPTVNLEAEACGTPVLTYDTGGSKETIGRVEASRIVSNFEDAVNLIIEYASFAKEKVTHG